MRVDNQTISDMFDVLHDKIVDAGAPQNIEFYNVTGDLLCEVPFEDIVEDSSILGEFYFEDPFGSRIIRGIVDNLQTDMTATNFEIKDDGTIGVVVSGSVGLLNSGADITFNAVEWSLGQVVIISSLKIYFPTES